MKYLSIVITLTLICASHYSNAQLLPVVHMKFNKVSSYKFKQLPSGETTSNLLRTENAISKVDITASNDGERTYFKFFSSLMNGETVMIVNSTEVSTNGSNKIYTAYCSSLVYNKASTWILSYQNNNLIKATYYIVESNGFMEFYNDASN